MGNTVSFNEDTLGGGLCQRVLTPQPSTVESFHSRYSLGKQLGKGAQGRVHVCLHKTTGSSFAVKLIDRNVKTSWTTYRREVDLCRSAQSQNVVSVLADFVDPDYCYIVMERFEGHLRKGLKWVAKEAPQPAGLCDEALRGLVRQVLEGIQHLHGCNIIHRDIKSHNVFIDRLNVRDPGCRVVIGDLGLARRLEQGRFLCAQVGTRKYWAPELYDKKYTHNVDVFALGVLFFLIVCSSYPYLDEQQTRQRDVFGEGCVPSSLSPSALSFLRTALVKCPASRPSAAELTWDPWLFSGQSHAGQGSSQSQGQTSQGHSQRLGQGFGRIARAAPTLPLGATGSVGVPSQPLPPQVCRCWQSRQVPRVRGDVHGEVDEGSSASFVDDPDACCEEWEAESTTLRRPPQSCREERGASTPTTACDSSSATASPSTKSLIFDSDRRLVPPADQLEQDTAEELQSSSESASGRPEAAAVLNMPKGSAAVWNCKSAGRESEQPPEIESL